MYTYAVKSPLRMTSAQGAFLTSVFWVSALPEIHNSGKFDLQRHAAHQFHYYQFLERLLLLVN